ncbi:MAG: S41 family peptidase [Candidatus Glassbacteria bacterium]|nr:S41 family peptidase [Candidatus Glassbacteria bacterium]
MNGRDGVKILVAMLLLLGLSGTAGSQFSEDRGAGTRNYQLLQEVLDVLSDQYVDEVPTEDLIMGAVEGLVGSLDPHSQLLDKRRHNRLMEQTRGEFGGIGIEISIRDDTLTVLSPIPGTPAHRVGLQSGDRIVNIEHEPTDGMSLEDAVKRLKGKPGTKVNIWISRVGIDEPIHFEITRAIIKIESLQGKFMLTPEIGYIRLGVFSDKSGREMAETIVELKKLGMKKLIFDLRDNPGGLLSRAVDVADIFLSPGEVIVSTRGRINSSNQVFKSRRAPLWESGAVVTLISGGSASASEIVSGALQDHDKAVIMGTTSYGKGSVQTIIDLRDSYALKLTTAKYYTPSGRCIHSDRRAGEQHHALLSAEDTAHVFLTDSGRKVRGGGGITPDLVTRPDSMSEAERKIFRQAGKFRNLLFRYAVQFKNEHPEYMDGSLNSVTYTENFREKVVTLTDGMVDNVRRRMLDEGFELTEEEFAQTDELFRHWIYYYIADAGYDRNTAQRVSAGYDSQLRQALELLRSAPSEGDFVETVLAGRTLPDTLEAQALSR